MEVECVLIPEDIVAFHKYTWRHPSKALRKARRSRRGFIFFTAAMTAVLIAGLVWADPRNAPRSKPRANPHPGWLLVGLAGLTAPAVLIPVLWLAVLARPLALCRLKESLRQGKYDKVLGQHRISLTSEAFTCANEMSTEILKWKAVERIIVTERHAFFFVSEVAAYILPKRSFEREADFHLLVKTARNNLEAAQKSKFTTNSSSEAIRPA